MRSIAKPLYRNRGNGSHAWYAVWAVALTLLIPCRAYAQTGTVFPGPIWIQPQETPAASLQVDRINGQPSALDIFSHGGGDEIRFFSPDPIKGQVLRSYVDYNGAFHTNAWLVISGALSSDSSPTPEDLYPTTDPFMLGVWSDVEGPAVVIRPTMTSTPDAPFATMDGSGNYRLSILDDGSLNFAGPDANSFANTDWDTVLHRVGPGELRTEGEFSAASIADTPLLVSLTNDSPATILPGTVLRIDPARDRSFLPSVNQEDSTVVGIAAASIAPGISGLVMIRGVGQVQVTGYVPRGSLLVTATGNGVARSVAPGEVPVAGAILGKALSQSLTATGTITAIINP